VFRFVNVSLSTQEDLNAPSDTGFDNVSLSPLEDMNTPFDTSFDNVSPSPQEDMNAPFDTNFDIHLDLNHDCDSLGPVDAVQVCLIATQTLPLTKLFPAPSQSVGSGCCPASAQAGDTSLNLLSELLYV
jgi:hypothetical protein